MMCLYNMEIQEAIKILSLNNNESEIIYETDKNVFEENCF